MVWYSTGIPSLHLDMVGVARKRGGLEGYSPMTPVASLLHDVVICELVIDLRSFMLCLEGALGAGKLLTAWD